MSVAVVDRADFPSDTPSTHILQVEGVASLARLGVLDRVLATGAPWLERVDVRMGEARMVAPVPCRAGDPGPGLCVRRRALDAILVDAAQAAGAEVHTRTRVVGLLRQDERVSGVRVRDAGGERDLDAALVVGADGMGSTVARIVGARRYNVVPNQRFGCWGYYQGADWAVPAALVYHRWGREFVIGCPTDDGLYLVIVIPPLDRLSAFRADVETSWDTHLGACQPVAAAVAGARRVGRLHAMVTYPAFFRESVGPGWVLVGDAGHVTDPTPGQGISDALRQVDRLAPVIVDGLSGAGSLDRELHRWESWRNRDAAEMHWFAAELGKATPSPAVVERVLARIGERPVATAAMIDVLNHRRRPSEVLTRRRVAAAAVRLLVRGGAPRGRVVADVSQLLGEDLRHRRQNRRPRYEPEPAAALDPSEERGPARPSDLTGCA